MPGGIMPGMGIMKPGRGGKPPIYSRMLIAAVTHAVGHCSSPELYWVLMSSDIPTWMCHHVLCLLLQPVHVVQFDCFLVLATRVVGLAH